MNVVLTLVPIISSTDDWISGSVNRLMCPFRTVESRDNMRSEYNIAEEMNGHSSYLSCPKSEAAYSYLRNKKENNQHIEK